MSLKQQIFSGNNLNRSFDHHQSSSFLIDCIRTPTSKILIALATETNQIKLLTQRNSLLYMNISDLLNITNVTSPETLVSEYLVILLGNIQSANEDVWHLVIRLPSTYENIIIEYLSSKLKSQSTDMDSKSISFSDGRNILLKFRQSSEIAVAGQAIALVSWHYQNLFDGKTGRSTIPIECGLKRAVDENSSSKLYPRTDPVVIGCIVSPDKKRCLLGSMKKLPKNFYSCISGFIEPCESVEEALRREAKEESGILLGDVEILSSQPWPIGRGGGCELMIGCIAQALTEDIEIHDDEVEAVKWFPRDEVAKLLEKSLKMQDFRSSEVPFIPGPYAIAHHLIKVYLDRTLVVEGVEKTVDKKEEPNSSSTVDFKISSSILVIGALSAIIGFSVGIAVKRFK